MQVPTQIHKPANWQDFETLCMKLWGRIWDCADTIKKMVVPDRNNMELTY